MTKKLEIQNLKINSFGYETHNILDIPYYCHEEVSELLVTGGANAGKTTFLYAIAGLFLKLEGKVNWNAKDIYKMQPRQRDSWNADNVGIIYQNFQLNEDISVLDNILQPTGFDSVICPEHLMQKAEMLAEKFEVSIFAPIGNMTQAQKQHIALARALVKDANIIIADELTAGLDSVMASKLLNHLRFECAQDEKILVLASDDAMVAEQINHKLELRHGRIVETSQQIHLSQKMA